MPFLSLSNWLKYQYFVKIRQPADFFLMALRMPSILTEYLELGPSSILLLAQT